MLKKTKKTNPKKIQGDKMRTTHQRSKTAPKLQKRKREKLNSKERRISLEHLSLS